MIKTFKFLGKSTVILLEWVLIFVIFFSFAIRSYRVQTKLAQIVTDYLSSELNTIFRVSKLDVVNLNKIYLDGVYVEDLKRDTLVSLGSLYVKFDIFKLLDNKLNIHEFGLEDGFVKLNKEKGNENFNFQFIVDYFATPTKSKTDSPSIIIDVKKINLTNINFYMDDDNYEPMDFGVDYSHLKVAHLNLSADNLFIEDDLIIGNINKLNFVDLKSGFNVKSLIAKVEYSNKGLKLDALKILTEESNIDIPKFHLLTTSPDGFSYFVDTVVFDSKINQSKVSLKDVSYFATILEGMDEVVQLKGEVSQRVKDLKLDNIDLSFGKHSFVRGNMILPNFDNMDELYLNQNIDLINVTVEDLSNIKMPKSAGGGKIDIRNTLVDNVEFLNIANLSFKGNVNSFTVDASRIRTKVGSFSLNDGINIVQNDKAIKIQNVETEKSLVRIDSLNLGILLDDYNFGTLSGDINLLANIYNGKFDATDIDVTLDRLGFKGYNYTDILLTDADFVNNIFRGNLNIEDQNIKVDLKANIDLNTKQRFTINVDKLEANLEKLKLYDIENSYVSTSFFLDVYGSDINNYSGSVLFNDIFYKQLDQKFILPTLYIEALQKDTLDKLMIRSKLINADVKGKVDFNTITYELSEQLSKAFPTYVNQYKINKKYKSTIDNNLNFDIKIGAANDLLALFVKNINITNGLNIKGKYLAKDSLLNVDINSKEIHYERFIIHNLNINSVLEADDLKLNLYAKNFYLNDSVKVDSLNFVITGFNGVFNSNLYWYENNKKSADFLVTSDLKEKELMSFLIDKSYFVLSGHKWEIPQKSVINIRSLDYSISNFIIQNGDNYLKIDGRLTDSDADKLTLDIKDFQLGDFSNLIGLDFAIKGKANGAGEVANIFKEPIFLGNMRVDSLYLDKNEVGDLNINGSFDRVVDAVKLNGDLFYKKNQTFLFDGNYYLNKSESLDFDLTFDRTDIRFVNSLVDSTLVSNIQGVLEGKSKITGKPSAPIIDGDINLYGGNVKVGMFGVNFGLEGKIDLKNGLIKSSSLIMFDEEGNTGIANVVVKHNSFSDIYLDVNLNLEDDGYSVLSNSRYKNKLDRFLVMNTSFKEGDLYYGKAYVTGMVNIKGFMDDMYIGVDVKTQKGTVINLPMFENSELEESSVVKFVEFGYIDTLTTRIENKIDYSGINLDLNFDVNENAVLKIVMDPTTGDELTATGRGKINMTLNSIGDVAMNGTFNVTGGAYNFTLATIKQPFIIDGGTVNFTGDIMNARMDIKAYALVNANVAEILYSAEKSKSTSNQDVYCYILISGGLSQPIISFDIDVPKASEENLAALNRVKSDQDELNKQFFSLLLLKKFQPLGALKAGNSNAALDIVANQINSALSQLSNDYRFNVDFDKNTLTGNNSYELGMSKNFLDERLIISGSFGVENNTRGASQNMLIGDVNVDYLLNETGTFKIGVFNESNDYSVMQEKSLGRFTQGVSITYREDFNNWDDFKLGQSVLDFFRKDENIKIIEKRKKRRKLLPEFDANRKEEEN